MEIYDDFELTEDDYKIAEKNGLSRKLVYQRFYVGWEKEDAVTVPKGNSGILKRLQEKAASNGIELSIGAISSRRNNLKWSDEDVVTVPKGGHRKMENDYYHYIKIATSNGIKRSTYDGRRRRGWAKERAATEAVQSAFNWRVRA